MEMHQIPPIRFPELQLLLRLARRHLQLPCCHGLSHAFKHPFCANAKEDDLCLLLGLHFHTEVLCLILTLLFKTIGIRRLPMVDMFALDLAVKQAEPRHNLTLLDLEYTVARGRVQRCEVLQEDSNHNVQRDNRHQIVKAPEIQPYVEVVLEPHGVVHRLLPVCLHDNLRQRVHCVHQTAEVGQHQRIVVFPLQVQFLEESHAEAGVAVHQNDNLQEDNRHRWGSLEEHLHKVPPFLDNQEHSSDRQSP
mmetsp:Transcript_2004/g.4608  ORF Transcript_2004/g.4608 Transcript_2004/m.4608 type:complete len:249 (+) Transcript_2004:284-1030(+)